MTEEFPTVSPCATVAMRRLLATNVLFRREMAAGRKGAIYMASVLIETRLLLDATEGRETGIKRLIGEVMPEWVGETTARGIVTEMLAEGLITAQRSAKDRRVAIVTPMPRLARQSELRWARIKDES